MHDSFFGPNETANDVIGWWGRNTDDIDSDYIISRVLRQNNGYTSRLRFKNLCGDYLEFMGSHSFINYKRSARTAQDASRSYLNNNKHVEIATLPIRALTNNIEFRVEQPEYSAYTLIQDANTVLDPESYNFIPTANKTNWGINIVETYKMDEPTAQIYGQLKQTDFYQPNLTIGINSWAPRKACAVTKQLNLYTIYIYRYNDVRWLYRILSVISQDILNSCCPVQLLSTEEDNRHYEVLAHDVFQALYDEDFQKYVDALQSINTILVEAIDQIQERERIANTLSQIADRKINNLHIRLERVENEIRHQEDMLASLYSNKATYLEHIAGVENEDNTQALQTLKNLLLNRREQIPFIHYNQDDDELSLDIITPCTSYNAETLERFLNNPRRSGDKPYDEVLKKIFIEQEYTIYLKQGIRFDLDECRVRTTFPNGKYCDTHGTPNPHTRIYECFGTNSSIISRQLSEGHIDLAILQTITSIGNLNFTDGTVTNEWINCKLERDDSEYTAYPCIKDDEGNWYSFRSLKEKLEHPEEPETTEESTVDTVDTVERTGWEDGEAPEGELLTVNPVGETGPNDPIGQIATAGTRDPLDPREDLAGAILQRVTAEWINTNPVPDPGATPTNVAPAD